MFLFGMDHKSKRVYENSKREVSIDTFLYEKNIFGWGRGGGWSRCSPKFYLKKIHKENGKVKCIYIYILLLHNNH